MKLSSQFDLARSTRHFVVALRIVIAVMTLGCVGPGCHKGNSTKTPFVYDEEKDEPFNQSNYSEQTRDGYTLRVWTDGSLFTLSDWVDFYLEVLFPKQKAPSSIRVHIEAPNVSSLHSDFHNVFTKSEFEYQRDDSLRIKIADCFRTRGTQKPPNVLSLGRHQMTMQVVLEEGPKFTFQFSIDVKRRSSD